MRRFNVVLALASFVALASQQPSPPANASSTDETNRVETSVPAYALRDDGIEATYITVADDVCSVAMGHDADTGERYIVLKYC